MDIEKFLRGLALGILGYALVVCMLMIANASVFSLITSNPGKMKSIVRSSGVYEKLPGVVYDETAAKSSSDVQSIPLNAPEIRSAALETFNPVFFRQNVETAVDGTYRWLEGKTERPEFSLDVGQAKKQFIEKAVDNNASRLGSLPPCQNAQAARNMNFFTLDCLPPGFKVDEAKELAKQELGKKQSFLEKTAYVPDDIKDDKGQPIYAGIVDASEKFKLAKSLPFFLIIAALFFSAGILLLSESRKSGVKRLARIFLVSGVFTMLAPIGIKFIAETLLSRTNDKKISEIIKPLVQEFNNASSAVYYGVGIIILILGAILLLAAYNRLHLPRKRN